MQPIRLDTYCYRITNKTITESVRLKLFIINLPGVQPKWNYCFRKILPGIFLPYSSPERNSANW